jgi:phosphatidylinositol 4-phosphatase
VAVQVRYYLNNFQDGKKQDAVDLVTGTYQVQRGSRLPYRSSPSPFLPLLVALAAFFFALSQLGQTGQVAEGGFKATAGHVVQAVLLPLTLSVGLVMLVVKNGRRLVNKPQLCPQLANTVDVGGGDL